MNCETCGRELKPSEKKYCPACKNNNDKQKKTGGAIVGAIAVVGAACVAGVLALIGGDD